MNPKLSKLKVLLIGFVLTKVVITVVYFVGTLPLADLVFTRSTAVAQESITEEKAAGASVDQQDADKEAQYADVQALMNQLEVKRLQLKDEEERLKQERTQLEQLKRDIDMKLDKLAAVQADIDASLEKKSEAATQEQQAQEAAYAAKVKQLVKVYTSMSPKKAAEIIDKLDMNVVYDVFSNMKGEQVGQILTYVSGERAVEITERLAANSPQ